MENWQFLSFLVLGLLLGLRHALEVDHVVTVSTIASETKSLKKSSLIGLFWGMGHSTALFGAGLVILLFKVSIPARLSLFFEFLVGLALIIIGIQLLLKSAKAHIHQHEHDGKTHSHYHESSHHLKKSYSIGFLNGLAGSGALMLIVLSASKNLTEGFLYLFFFGVGSILGMLALSTVIGLHFLFSKRLSMVDKFLPITASCVSIFLGITIVLSFLK